MAEAKHQGRKYSGTLYGRKFGSSDGFQKLGNVSSLTTSREVETDTLQSTAREDYGEAISAEVKPGATEVKISFNSFDREGYARALMGEALDLGGSPNTVVDAPYQVADGWLKLADKDIDESTLLIVDSSATEVDASTYTLNAKLGMVQFNDTSTLTVGEAITVSYVQKGTAGYYIDANTLDKQDLELLLDGRDRISGAEGELSIPHAVISADGDQDWFSDDWWENGTTGTLIKEPGQPTMRFTEYSS